MRTDNIIMSLINTEKYCHVLETVPHRDVLDLSVIYRSVTETPDGGICSIIVNNSMLKKLNLTKEELHELALFNTMENYPLKLEPIESHFYVLSNEMRVFGAIGMFITDEISNLAEMYERSMFILPSSVHEVFVIPDFGQEKEYLESVVRDANDNVVKGKDILSDNVYYYDVNEKRITIA